MLRALRRAGQLTSGLQWLAAKEAMGKAASMQASVSAAAGFSTALITPSTLLLRHFTLPAGCWSLQAARQFRSASALWDALDLKVPQMGDSVSEGTIASILKKEGDSVSENDVIAQIETDKVTIDVKYTSSQPGKITAMNIKESDVVQPGQSVCTVEVGAAGGEAPAASEAKPAKEAKEAKPEPAAAPKPAAAPAKAPEAPPKPAAKPAAPAPPQPPPQAAAAPESTAPRTVSGTRSPSAAPAPPTHALKPERRVKMTRLRMRVAERLKGAQNTYAMLTTFNEVDMSSLMEMRTTYKDLFLEKHGVKLGFMSAFIKASAYALNEVPAVNAVIDGDEIVYRDYVDISIAVATPKGLVVPVLRSADKLSFANCEKSLNALGKKAREGTISIDDMAGGTFTISNGGVYGSLLSTPIINPPQSAILGMHAIVKKPVVVDGSKIEARPIMNIALTYDHRLIDGREAVTFLKRVKEVIEDPRRMLIDC